MLTPELPDKQRALIALPEPTRVVLAEDSPLALSVVLPPLEDLAEMEELKGINFSIEEFTSDQVAVKNKVLFQNDFSALAEKADRYVGSAVYLSKLASLAGLAGRADEERELLKRALELDDSRFYAHRFGDALFGSHDSEDVRRYFSNLDLRSDIGANLRLAALCVQRRDLGAAEAFVRAAVEIDPLDFNARLFHGGLNLFKANFISAAQSFKAAIEERPTSSSAYRNLALAYLGLKQDEKALSCLKKSVALDPLDVNSIFLLSDQAFRMDRDEDSVLALRYYVQYEQKNEAIWSRLARACFRIGRYDEAIAALKREGSLRDSSSVWNNLGVSYLRLGNRQKSLESFKHAMRLDAAHPSRTYYLAARNIAQLLSSLDLYSEVRSFTRPILTNGDFGVIAADDETADLIVFYVHALIKDRHVDEAIKVIIDTLSEESISNALSVWLVSALLSRQALTGRAGDVIGLTDNHDKVAQALGSNFKDRTVLYFNNVAFAFAELGQLADAEFHLSKIANVLHKSAYPTATLGLIHFKKGNVEKGKLLYEEAVRLASTKIDKARIRQKLNYELAKSWLVRNEQTRAKRLLEKVASEGYGEDELAKQAKQLIGSLRSG